MSRGAGRSNCITEFFEKVMAMARSLPLRVVPLEDRNATVCGLYMMANPVDLHDKTKTSPKADIAEKIEHPALSEELVAFIDGELDQLSAARYPCALILLRIHSADTHPAVSGTQVKLFLSSLPETSGAALLAGADTFSLFCPDTDLQEALDKTEKIVDLLARNLGKILAKPAEISLQAGICVNPGNDTVSAEKFVRAAADKLEESRRNHNGAPCHCLLPARKTSCQVTAEERAELFNFLKG